MINDRNISNTANIQPHKILGGGGFNALLGAGPVGITHGNIYYVNKDGGSDTLYDGLSPVTPFATIAKAITIMKARINWSASPWSNHDTVIIYPGLYAENLTSLPYGCNVIGLGDAFDLNGERGVKIKPASGSPVDASAVINTRIENICFESPDTTVVFQADTFNRNVLVNCVFQGLPGASPTTVKGLEITTDMTGNIVSNCWFNQIRNSIHITTVAPKQATGNMISDITILGGDQTGIYFDANCVPTSTIINNCNIAGAGATLALGLDDNTGVVTVMNTNFQATACDPASGDGDSKYNNCYLNGGLMT